MSTTTTEPEVSSPAPRKSRIGKILRWAARLTSIPILAMVLTSLIPALASFSISAKDDKIIALGLCATCVGLLIGWRWAGVGGGIVLLGVGIIFSQADSTLSGDPFSVAFGLQGILFLISWILNTASSKGPVASAGWLKKVAAAALALCAVAGALILFRGPGPTPLPKEKEAYVGTWDNGAGFKLELTSEGRARITQEKDSKVDSCNTPVSPGRAGDFLAYFRADDRLELSSGVLGSSKVYHIDRRPFTQGKQIKMVLNGSDPYQRNSGMVLVKKEAAEAGAPKPVGKEQKS